MKTSPRGIGFIKAKEGFRPAPYKCSAGRWTIGYGHVILPGERLVLLTEPEASELLARDLVQRERDVEFLVKVPLNQNEFDALVALVFNIGSDIDDDEVAEGLGDSTLLKKLNAGDRQGAADEFLKWCKATINGVRVTVDGLLARRQEERAIFLEA